MPQQIKREGFMSRGGKDEIYEGARDAPPIDHTLVDLLTVDLKGERSERPTIETPPGDVDEDGENCNYPNGLDPDVQRALLVSASDKFGNAGIRGLAGIDKELGCAGLRTLAEIDKEFGDAGFCELAGTGDDLENTDLHEDFRLIEAIVEQVAGPPDMRANPLESGGSAPKKRRRVQQVSHHQPAPRYYDVEKIVGYKDGPTGPLYRVKWEGYPTERNTWEPEQQLIEDGVSSMILEFKEAWNRKHPDDPFD